MPAVDGKTLSTNPFDPVASPVSADVPIMVGSTKDEATNVFLSDPTSQTMTEDALAKRVGAVVGPDKVKAPIAIYRTNAPYDAPKHMATIHITAHTDRKSLEKG